MSRGNKLIVSAPSNVAVDNLVDQLAQYKKSASANIVRLGHPARASESGRLFTLDSLILQSDFSDVIRDLRNEIFKSKQILSTPSENSSTVVKEAAGKISHLKKDLKELEGAIKNKDGKFLFEKFKKTKMIREKIIESGQD